MNSPDPDQNHVEKTLARLLPSALSQRAQEDLELMLDQLSTSSATTKPQNKISLIYWLSAGGIAAAVGLFLSILPDSSEKSPGYAIAKPSADSIAIESSFASSSATSFASLTSSEGRLDVRRVGSEVVVQHFSQAGKLLQSLPVSDPDQLESLPVSWRHRASLLCQCLQETPSAAPTSHREPLPQSRPAR